MMRMGVCGTGTVASWISGILNKLGDENIVLYGCATSPGFDCTEFAEQFKYQKRFDSFQQLMDDRDVDVVYIAVPNNLHLGLVEMALAAGKHVICEKPMAISEDECRRMITMAQEKNLFIMEALWAAFLPMKQMVMEAIASGMIGEVTGGKVVQMDNIMFIERVKKLDLCGGYLLDNGPYTIGWMVDYFGTDIKLTTAKMRKHESGVDAEDWITVEYANGATVNIHQAMDTPEDSREEYAEIIGTKGKILFEKIANPQEVRVVDNEGNVTKRLVAPPQIKNPGVPPVSGYQYEFQAAERAISNGEKACAAAAHDKSIAIAHVMTEARKQCGLVFPFE